jgi:predicted RNA binding protein YcfA (HicA-like mRNA interferase family)
LTQIVLEQYYLVVPRKIRELIRILKNAGFVDRGGKGSHRNLTHPLGVKITLSGRPSVDARRYQEREVERALREAKR